MKTYKIFYMLIPFLSLVACNWGHQVKDDGNKVENNDSINAMVEAPSEVKTGVGPIKEPVELGMEINKEMAAKREEIFNKQCTICHEIHNSNRGPALGGVLEKRSPQWVMNMILNPDGMIENDPQVKALKAVYETRMVDLKLTQEEARQVVEYLRTY
ncbi:MAG: cytochrome C [Aequorivita sp.]|nr:cytochrome C [Aequorivita sp.]MBF31689.1 cytochrome C [Aequorivita sp.]|tara:strand:+ start:79300 stop:79770 length:471 start_codon:yes stop_codon:yes gene_type:complete